MVWVSRPARPLQITQQMLSLRRMAEAEAQAELRAARAELERVRHSEQAAVQRRQQMAKMLAAAEKTAQSTQTIAANELAEQAMRLQLLRGELRRAEADEAARGHQVSQLRRRIEELQAHLRLCVARREAAEQHEAAERREQRRQRERRERAIEEDARDRVLSASRPNRRA